MVRATTGAGVLNGGAGGSHTGSGSSNTGVAEQRLKGKCIFQALQGVQISDCMLRVIQEMR